MTPYKDDNENDGGDIGDGNDDDSFSNSANRWASPLLHMLLSEICITMTMQGYRKVRGCENSKMTWYPRQLLPTLAKLVAVYERA